jgi:hypothetical protein
LRDFQWPITAVIACALAGCNVQESTLGGSEPDERSVERSFPTDNYAFGNVQPHHIREQQYHDDLRSYGPHALFVCNAGLAHQGMIGDLHGIVGDDVTLLANDPSRFVPLWGNGSEFWEDYRAAMDPATVGLPDSAWYWISEYGFRMPAPRPCRNGGWCGEYWPGWALKPERSAYRAKAEFLVSRLGEFDGLFLDEWHAGFAPYQLDGLGIPREMQAELTAQWVECRKFYLDVLREMAGPGFVLVGNIQAARRAAYQPSEIAAFDGHTTEFADLLDLSRFVRNPSPFNVCWSGPLNATGVVRRGFGLPGNVDP